MILGRDVFSVVTPQVDPNGLLKGFQEVADAGEAIAFQDQHRVANPCGPTHRHKNEITRTQASPVLGCDPYGNQMYSVWPDDVFAMAVFCGFAWCISDGLSVWPPACCVALGPCHGHALPHGS